MLLCVVYVAPDVTKCSIILVSLSAPSSCVVTEWGEWDPCSVTCGLGMRRRERMVKMPPIDGSMCKTEVAEVEKCMMPECRKLLLQGHYGVIHSYCQ